MTGKTIDVVVRCSRGIGRFISNIRRRKNAFARLLSIEVYLWQRPRRTYEFVPSRYRRLPATIAEWREATVEALAKVGR